MAMMCSFAVVRGPLVSFGPDRANTIIAGAALVGGQVKLWLFGPLCAIRRQISFLAILPLVISWWRVVS